MDARQNRDVEVKIHVLVQPLFDILPCFAVRPFVVRLPNDESSAVSERLRPRPEDAVLDEAVETVDESRWQGDRNGLPVLLMLRRNLYDG